MTGARTPPTSARRQRGVATVMMALLVGTAAMASTFAVVQQVRTSQDQSMTVHAQTQAQMNAWAGAEMVRQYLQGLTNAQRATLLASVQASSANTTLSFSSDMGVSAVLLPASTSSNFLARVTGITAAANPKAKTTATLELNYAVATSTSALSSLSTAFKAGMGTTLGGTITIQTATASQGVFNVAGDLLSGGYSITGANTINATGTINLGSNSSFQVLNSNCDVVISGTTQSVTINARRHVCGSGTAKVTGVATANGSISMGAAGNGTLAAIGDTRFTDSCSASGFAGSATLAATCAAPTYGPGVDLGSGSGSATTVKSRQSVYVGSGTIGSLAAALDLVLKNWNPTVNGSVGGQVVRNGYNYQGTVTTGGASPSITPVQAVSIQADTPFNANDYRAYANYAFYVSGSDLKVDIKNVNGVGDGSYFIGTTGRASAMRYACSFSGDNCNLGNKTLDLCTNTTNTQCLSYSAGKWTLATDTTAGMLAGVAWFGGSLLASTGTYYNTFITSANITTGGTHTVYAPNYAGYSGKVGATTYAPSDICTTSAGTAIANYPSNFCNLATASFDPSASGGLGSYAYMAGSYSGASYAASNYVGGNVALGGASVNGYVLAGNAFSSGGVSTIRGYISSQGSGVAAAGQSSKNASLGANTTIDMRSLPATLAAGGAGGSSASAGSSSAGAAVVSILYSRYL